MDEQTLHNLDTGVWNAKTSNPFPSLLIITEGKGKGKVGSQPVELTEGNAAFIPKDTSHEFWSDLDRPMEGILLMFGEGA